MTRLTQNYDRALMYASAVHGGQVRKGTQIPCVAHLMAVSAVVLDGGVVCLHKRSTTWPPSAR